MILQSKMEELQAFLRKQDEERTAFLKKWEADMREELGLPRSPAAKLGVSFEPGVEFKQLPPSSDVPAGLYNTRDGLTVEVTLQDPETKLLVLEMPPYVPARDRLQTMSVGIFTELFVPVDASPTTNTLDLVNHEFEYQTDPAKREHLASWQKNFDWVAIQEQYEALCEKFVRLDKSLGGRDKEATQMYFLEALFLFYILGNRLGYSSAFKFRSLHETIFSLVDHTAEAALHTQNLYWGQAVETEYREVLLYDPADVMRAPEKYYLTFSAKDQASPDGAVLPKGCFLRSKS
jgi:hypothetical protein